MVEAANHHEPANIYFGGMFDIPLGIPATVMQMEAQMVVSSDKRRPETATGN